MKNRFILLLLVSVVLIGCTTGNTMNTATNVFVSSVNVKYEYENGELVDIVLKDTLTENEVEVLIDALDNIEQSKNVINNIANNPTDLIVELTDVIKEYFQIRDSYVIIRNIVINNQDDYTEFEWEQLKKFDNSVLVLNNEFLELVERSETSLAIRNALQFADTAYMLSELL